MFYKRFLIVINYIVLYTLCSLSLSANESAVIAIDIGHTLEQAGATSARGISEFHFNKNIAEKLHAQLQQRGFKQAFIINPQGRPIKLQERTKLAKKKQADLFVSIHHDSMQLTFLKKWQVKGKDYLHSEKFKGYSLFISQKKRTSQRNTRLAYAIADSLLNNKFTPSLHHAIPIKGENRRLINSARGIYEFPELAVLRTAKMPAILVECGVIVNKDEEQLLSDTAYQQKIVNALADGIVTYLHGLTK
jgi:N-acetylmuramoyl-L-alanine amidase